MWQGFRALWFLCHFVFKVDSEVSNPKVHPKFLHMPILDAAPSQVKEITVTPADCSFVEHYLTKFEFSAALYSAIREYPTCNVHMSIDTSMNVRASLTMETRHQVQSVPMSTYPYISFRPIQPVVLQPFHPWLTSTRQGRHGGRILLGHRAGRGSGCFCQSQYGSRQMEKVSLSLPLDLSSHPSSMQAQIDFRLE